VREHRGLEALALAVLGICAPLWLLLSNLYPLATRAFVRYEYSKPSFPVATRYSAAERLSLAEATLHYMRSDEDTEHLVALESQGRPVYNLREIKHLVDAKRVMRGAFALHAVCGLLCVLAGALLWCRKEGRLRVLRSISVGCLALVAILLAIGILAYANFGLFFTIFHRLLFEGDSWLFAYSDTLIQLFPVRFWMDATWMLSLLTVGECMSAAVLAYALSGRLKETQ